MGGSNQFQFKRFTVEQEGCAMKVGTDGVLLGAWCRIRPEDKLLLDIGTGTGVIALMLAQRTESSSSTIASIEPDAPSSLKARENFDASGWGGRINLHRATIQDHAAAAAPDIYDNIVSNPPYFIDSLLSPEASRNSARHAASLPYEELAAACAKLLKADGIFSLVLPAVEGERMIAVAAMDGFHVSRRTEVWSTPHSGPKRLLLEFSRGSTAAAETSSLVIEDAGPGTFSDEYRALTRDFYLYF